MPKTARLSEPASLSLPGHEHKEEVLAIARAWLVQQRERLKAEFLTSGDAGAYLAGYAAAMDQLLRALYHCAAPKKTLPVALVAVGGYGRSELFPYSDIDLLFLYDGHGEKEAARLAEFVLYILWDLGLKVGQAHRSVEESIALAGSDMTIRTALLDARLIAGQQAVFKRFQAQFAGKVAEGTALEFVEAKLAERDARHGRFGDSRYMLEPNVKEGKGGLRDLHTLWWLARYIYPVKDMHDLVALDHLTLQEYQAFAKARQFLWQVRIHLHLLAGRAEERLTFDRQQALAVAMGFNHPSVNRSIERFMRRYFVAVRTVGSMTRIFCALLEEGHQRKSYKALGWLWQAPWHLGSFELDGQRLNVRSEDAFEEHPVQMIELFRVAQMHNLDIHPQALQLITRSLKRIDDTLRHDPKANSLFLEVLLAREGPETALRRMSEAGVLGRFIPDFGRIIGQTQFNMYHAYTVDEHTLVALGILHAMEKGRLRGELPLTSEIIHRIRMRRVLYLALMCHDIAKGRGGDHSELGEKIVSKLAARFGFSPDEIETAAWLVRHHLLFSNTAFKRDINDAKTIEDFVAEVQSPERLKLLLVLTAADIRAVGPKVWNAWKGALLRDLYHRAEQYMGAGDSALPHPQTDRLKSELVIRLPGWKRSEVEHWLEQGNPAFWANFDAAHHALIARLAREAEAMEWPLMVDTRHDHKRSITEIIICASDQPALFCKVAGALSLAGANITGAKVFTLKSGIAIDVLQVQDATGKAFDRPDRLAKMAVYIEQALSGELDLAEAFLRRATDYTSTSRDAIPLPSQVFIDNDASNICSVIELAGRDRSGFLYEVTHALAELGLTIATAHISTYGTQAADVFYVKDAFGMKLTHEGKCRQVREVLLRVMG